MTKEEVLDRIATKMWEKTYYWDFDFFVLRALNGEEPSNAGEVVNNECVDVKNY